MGHGQAGAHVDHGVDRAEGRTGTQRVAADVAGHDGLHAAELGEDETVRAAGAEGGRTARQVVCRGGVLGGREPEGGPDLGGSNLTRARQRAGGRGCDLDAHRADGVGEVRAGLLDHVELVDLRREVAHGTGGQRPGHAQLEHGRVGQRLADVLVERAGDHDADRAVAQLHTVELGLIGPGGHLVAQAVLLGAAAHGKSRHHHVLVRLALVGRWLVLGALACGVHECLCVRDAHGLVQHHRRVEALGDVPRGARHLVGLLAVGGVQARDARKGGVVAGVLLVLRRIAGRVVGHQDHKAARDAGIGRGHEGVGRDVEAHVLHRGEAADAAHRAAERGLERDLLVG